MPYETQPRICKIDASLLSYTYHFMIHARTLATKTTQIRETTLANLCMGLTTPSLTMFPCPPDSWASFYTQFQQLYTGANVTRAGRMGEHYDLTIQGTTHDVARAELKVTAGNPSPLSSLEWRPWMDSVQFAQGQVKSTIGRRFLGDCGEPMMRAWFETEVQPFSKRNELMYLEEHTHPLTYIGYMKAIFTIGMKGHQEKAAKDFIGALRANPILQKELHERWLAFESSWLETHTLDHHALLTLVKEMIEVKDIWICVSKKGPQLIRKLSVHGLRYDGVMKKRDGGAVFRYSLQLARDGEIRIVPLICKFHWKNGGQAVQNLNFLLI